MRHGKHNTSSVDCINIIMHREISGIFKQQSGRQSDRQKHGHI